MKKTLTRLFCLALCAVMLLSAIPAASAADGDYIAAEHTPDNGSPYYIMVNRSMNTVTIYTVGASGYYDVPFKAMICSTGRYGCTPLGTYSLSGWKTLWCHMVDGSYGQYVSQFYGDFLFHSVCYDYPDPSTLITEEYNQLGSSVSRGCVRLQSEDAKWIYDNCPAGTRVTIYDGTVTGALGQPEKAVPEITAELDNGWDPTDPRADNPWKTQRLESITLSHAELLMPAGGKAALLPSYTPVAPLAKDVSWTSSSPDVASVDPNGTVSANSTGSARITVSCGSVSASCTVTVVEPSPFRDVAIDAWYYPYVKYVSDQKLMIGAANGLFCPDGAITRAMAVQIIYNIAVEPSERVTAEGSGWYLPALEWVTEHGLLDGIAEQYLAPGHEISRQEFATLLYRYDAFTHEHVPSGVTLDGYEDAGEISSCAEEAMRWAVEQGILKGVSSTRLAPNGTMTRAQQAAILQRYMALN